MNKRPSNWSDATARYQSNGVPHVLITVLSVKGSVPREQGTKMVVTADDCIDTIGGGHLEFIAIEKARAMLLGGEASQAIEEFPLGPKLGQCCGGRVSLFFECFAEPRARIALFGAGHVGQALAGILAQLPVELIWIDSRAEQFPEQIPEGVRKVVDTEPVDQIAQLPAGSYVIVMTHNHPLDYQLVEAALNRGDLGYLGVIGSQTKAKRFRMRLAHRKFDAATIDKMISPIGLDAVPGKRPMEVAVSVAGQVIAQYHADLEQRTVDQTAYDHKALDQSAIDQSDAAEQPVNELKKDSIHES